MPKTFQEFHTALHEAKSISEVREIFRWNGAALSALPRDQHAMLCELAQELKETKLQGTERAVDTHIVQAIKDCSRFMWLGDLAFQQLLKKIQDTPTLADLDAIFYSDAGKDAMRGFNFAQRSALGETAHFVGKRLRALGDTWVKVWPKLEAPERAVEAKPEMQAEAGETPRRDLWQEAFGEPDPDKQD
jgi:hypothetical protein